MKNFLYFVLILAFVSIFSFFFNNSAFAGGSGGSWGCPNGWTTKPDGSCSFDGGGGGFGGGGGGTSPPVCTTGGWTRTSIIEGQFFATPEAACIAIGAALNQTFLRYDTACRMQKPSGSLDQWTISKEGECDTPPPPDIPDIPPPPDFPDIPPPPPDCDVCQSLYEIKLKINHLKNQDINNITNIVNNMSQTINNIDNSITDLSVNQQITNNNLTTINNNMGDLITNIENNNITNNEILNNITNIDNSMTEYSLRLGDIELALGDIELALDNTNKLVLGLKPDIDFIKNNLVNGSPEGKDYTQQLNQIIDLLKPCEPTAEIPCPDDDAIVKKLKEIQDYMQADFVPDTDSTEVEVEDLTNIELDRNLIKFGVAQCPPDNEFSTMVNGFSFSGGFKHKPLCDFFTLLSPFIKAFGGFSAALILGGGLRRG
ncbi:MAG: type II cytoskeletal 6A-like keratin [Inoviridae sp.]|nr:MAG: type II cytoskeletal 6A-like keratin [Inoviridae sp.]